MVLLIKYFGQGNAQGHIAPLCFIISVNGMPPEEFFYGRVKGLTNTSDSLAPSGHVYFCLTRGGTASLWKHWFSHVCIPEIKKVSDAMDIKNEDGTRQRAFLKTDGEACILDQAFSAEIHNQLESCGIDYLKMSPGRTSEEQEWDVSYEFNGLKDGIKQIVKSGESVENGYLQSQLEQYILDFKDAFPTVSISALFKEKWCYSILLITLSMKKNLNGVKLVNAFAKTGTFVRRPVGEKTCDFLSMMAQCKDKTISAPMLENMCNHKEEVGLYGLQHGRIDKEYLDSLNICITEGSVDRDNLTDCRKPAFLVSHVASYAAHCAQKEAQRLAEIDRLAAQANAFEARRLRDDENHQQALAQMSAADKQHQKDLATRAKLVTKELAKTAAADAKIAEISRVALLSDDEKAAEKLAKDEAKVLKKRNRDETLERITIERNERIANREVPGEIQA